MAVLACLVGDGNQAHFFLIIYLVYFNIVPDSLRCMGRKEEMEMKLTDSLPGTNITKFQVTQGILMMKAPSGLRIERKREVSTRLHHFCNISNRTFKYFCGTF